MNNNTTNGSVERNVFGSHEIAYECLADSVRTLNFKKAIVSQIKRDSIVMELGTGTGILSLFAAGAGAKKVDAYEVTVELARIAEKNVKDNNLESIIKIHAADVTSDTLHSEKYDVLIAELITVALIEEQLVPAFNHVLSQGLLKKSAICIPGRQLTYAQLVETDYNFFGYKLVTPQIEQTWQKSPIKTQISNPAQIANIDFNKAIYTQKKIDPIIDKICRFSVLKDGKVNAIRLLSDSDLGGGVMSGWTQCMNSPAIIPINEFSVYRGENVSVRIQYIMGGEMKSYQAERI